MKWYSKNLPNGQGLVIDEEDGRTVAAAYDADDADLLASAPDLLAACKFAVKEMWTAPDSVTRREVWDKLTEAIAKAEGK
jgi:hypothetical protein